MFTLAKTTASFNNIEGKGKKNLRLGKKQHISVNTRQPPMVLIFKVRPITPSKDLNS
jgi:hypothetical protein